jgi:hypothetical protein
LADSHGEPGGGREVEFLLQRRSEGRTAELVVSFDWTLRSVRKHLVLRGVVNEGIRADVW